MYRFTLDLRCFMQKDQILIQSNLSSLTSQGKFEISVIQDRWSLNAGSIYTKFTTNENKHLGHIIAKA